MRLKLSGYLILLFSFVAHFGFSQTGNDTILFINGDVIITTVTEIIRPTDTTNGFISFTKPKKPTKTKTVDYDRVFSITSSKGEELIYAYDTLEGNEHTVEEMRYFIKGEQDAAKAIKGNGGLITNFVLSTAACATGSFLSPIVPFAVSGILGLRKVKIKEGSVSNPEYLNHEAYLEGYEHEGKRKRKVKGLLGGTVGLVVGIGTSIVLKANGDELLK